MKNFVTLMTILLVSFVASAQAVDSEVVVQLKSRGSTILMNGEKLSPSVALTYFDDINGLDRSQDYLLYKKRYKTGVWLMSAGAGAFVLGAALGYVGLVFTIVSIPERSYQPLAVGMLTASAPLFFGGAGCMIAGIPVLASSSSRMKDLVAEYNTSVSSHGSCCPSFVSSGSLAFGPAPSGLGLTFSF